MFNFVFNLFFFLNRTRKLNSTTIFCSIDICFQFVYLCYCSLFFLSFNREWFLRNVSIAPITPESDRLRLHSVSNQFATWLEWWKVQYMYLLLIVVPLASSRYALRALWTKKTWNFHLLGVDVIVFYVLILIFWDP